MKKYISILSAALATIASCSEKPIYTNSHFTWQGDTISLNDGSIRAYAPDAFTIISNYPESEFPEGEWHLSRDISHLPSYSAPTRMEEALYNLSLEESVIAVEPDSTLRTGKNWSGVWTRDVSYSILLGLSHVQTKASFNSLVRKVDPLGRIIQDTGTGGSWPCSTDRTIWTVAAWELYKVTGDEDWLAYVYPIVKRSVEDDLLVACDPQTGLFRGESSYLDWREQEYPRWMAPVDIYQSENLGTACVHYENLRILAKMAERFGDGEDASRYNAVADAMAAGINRHLWNEQKGYYSQYLYGRRYLSASPRSETLGEALAVLYGIASPEQASRICSSVAEEAYGTPCFYPNIKDISPYHNDAMWPFVQAWWMDACNKAGNEATVMHAIACIYRLASFCLTNKENMVIYDGRWQGTAINSSRQLWSIAGNLNIVYSVLFGLSFEEDGLRFEPFVPKAMAGERTLRGFRYRGGTYDITLRGYGDGIRSFRVDGRPSDAFIPADAAVGEHSIVIELNGRMKPSSIEIVGNAYSPMTPQCRIDSGKLCWDAQGDAASYRVIRNGEVLAETSQTCIELAQDGEYQVIALGADGFESFASEALDYYSSQLMIELEDYGVQDDREYSGFGGKGYLPLTLDCNTSVSFPVELDRDGVYSVDFRFGNANGPINTENKCAIRTLSVDGERKGAVVMPQCGIAAWDIWRYSNPLTVELSAGTHEFVLDYRPENCNMNINVNSCALDSVRIIFISSQP